MISVVPWARKSDVMFDETAALWSSRFSTPAFEVGAASYRNFRE